MRAKKPQMKILISSDNHIGYLEKDPLRGSDSFDSFEEVLQMAQQANVDFVLLGGDLFHQNNPSRYTLYRTLEILKKYALGSNPSSLEYLSDKNVDFNGNDVNFENVNVNIQMPIFSIHGNHDEPSGQLGLASLDLIASTGLINYFGKQSKVDDVKISPILLKKGNVKLALYGLGNIRDQSLHRSFTLDKVGFVRPRNERDYFNIMVLHQNRVAHSVKNYIPETFLDSFLDFVIWGHEHECLIEPEHNPERSFFVSQPGSTVATSLCEGESKTKHVGILELQQEKWDFKKIRLKSVRPFVIQDLELEKTDISTKDSSSLLMFLNDQVEILIGKAIDEWLCMNPDKTEAECPKPLIRLRVEYSGGYNPCNPQRFGQSFVSKVANPLDILHFYRKRKDRKIVAEPDMPEISCIPQMEKLAVSDLVNEFLGVQNLGILPENQFHEAVTLFADREDRDAIRSFLDSSLEKTRKGIDICKIEFEDDDVLETEVARTKKAQFDEYNSKTLKQNIPAPSKKESRKRQIVESDHESSDLPSPAPVRASSCRTRKPKSSTCKSKPSSLISDAEDLSESFSSCKTKQTRGTSKKPKTSTKSKSDWIPSRTRPRATFSHETHDGDEDQEDARNVFESLL